MIGIYMYENKNNQKKYIGQSVDIERRRKDHVRYPSKFSKIDEEIQKFGEDIFTFSIIEECDIEILDERECYWIAYYNSNKDGYNLTSGGQNYRGSSNPRAKLKEQDVLEIISLLEQNNITNEKIANKYNVSRNTIDFINRCKIWNYLHNYKSNIRKEALLNSKTPHSTVSGENNGSCKIVQKQAEEIIYLLENSEISLAQLSRELQISLNIIYDINRCRTWKFLHNYKKNIRNESREKKGA